MQYFIKTQECNVKSDYLAKLALINHNIWMPHSSGIDIYNTDCIHLHTIPARDMGFIKCAVSVPGGAVVASNTGLHLLNNKGVFIDITFIFRFITTLRYITTIFF